MKYTRGDGGTVRKILVFFVCLWLSVGDHGAGKHVFAMKSVETVEDVSSEAGSKVGASETLGEPTLGQEQEQGQKQEIELPGSDRKKLAKSSRASNGSGEKSVRHAVRKIVIKGNKRVDTSTLLERFIPRPSKSYTREELDQFMKTIYDTGLFEDVRMRLDRGTLEIEVCENQIVNQITFEGNKSIEDSELRGIVRLRPCVVFTPLAVQEGCQNIVALYRSKGRFATKVTPKFIKRKQGRVDLIFEISEGPKSFVQRIFFVGNRSFGDDVLSDVISTKETNWFKFFSSEDVYDPRRVEYDGELLRQFYLKNGYIDFSLKHANAELSQDREGFFITFAIQEGDRYRFGKTTIRSELKGVKTLAIERFVDWESGEWFNASSLHEANEEISKYLGIEGHPFCDVSIVHHKNTAEKTVDIEIILRPTEPMYVNQIHIKGNVGTDDTVLRRELMFSEGAPLNTAKLGLAEDALRALDFFETVSVTDRPCSQKGYRDVTVQVKEKSTGEIQFGGGYGTTEGATGRIIYTDRNFLGGGRAINLKGYASQRGLEVEAGINEPYLFGKKFAGGLNIFHMTYRGDTRGTFASGGYRQNRTGVSGSLGYLLRRGFSQLWHYRVFRDQNVLRDNNMSPYLTLKRKVDYLSVLGHQLIFDRTKSQGGEPVGGYFLDMLNEVAGLGGTVRFMSNTFGFHNYVALDDEKKWILRGEVKFGVIWKFGYMRFLDRFTLGDYGFGGFATAGVGPRDGKTGDALGGREYYTAALKLYFPLGLPKDLPVKGIAYVQTGSLWNSGCSPSSPQQAATNPILSEKFRNRLSLGGGLVWASPIGKIGCLFSRAVVRAKCDKRQTFLLIYGQDF